MDLPSFFKPVAGEASLEAKRSSALRNWSSGPSGTLSERNVEDH